MRSKMLAATGPHQGTLAVRATDGHRPYHDTPFKQVFQLDFFLPGVQVLKRFGECNFRKLSGEYIFLSCDCLRAQGTNPTPTVPARCADCAESFSTGLPWMGHHPPWVQSRRGALLGTTVTP